MSKDKYNAPQGSDSEFVDEILAEGTQDAWQCNRRAG